MPGKLKITEISGDLAHNFGDEIQLNDNADDINYSGRSESDSDKQDIVASRDYYFQGTESFERYNVYGNHVYLSRRRWDFLKEQVSKFKTDIPFYVCEITKPIVYEGKMYFARDYTKKYLKNYLHKDRLLRVTNKYLKSTYQVMLSMGKHDGRAVITTNWGYVVDHAELLEGEMVIFWFKEHRQGLRVIVSSGIPILPHSWKVPFFGVV